MPKELFCLFSRGTGCKFHYQAASAERMYIKFAVGHGTTSNLWYVIWKQLRGKKHRSRFSDLLIGRNFLLNRNVRLPYIECFK